MAGRPKDRLQAEAKAAGSGRYKHVRRVGQPAKETRQSSILSRLSTEQFGPEYELLFADVVKRGVSKRQLQALAVCQMHKLREHVTESPADADGTGLSWLNYHKLYSTYLETIRKLADDDSADGVPHVLRIVIESNNGDRRASAGNRLEVA